MELLTFIFLAIGIVVVLFAAVIEGFCVLFAVVQSGAWCARKIREEVPRYVPIRLGRLLPEHLLRAADSPESRLRAVGVAPAERLLRPESARLHGGSNET